MKCMAVWDLKKILTLLYFIYVSLCMHQPFKHPFSILNATLLLLYCRWRCIGTSEQYRWGCVLPWRQLLHVSWRQPLWASGHRGNGVQPPRRHSRPEGVWVWASSGVFAYVTWVCFHSSHHNYHVHHVWIRASDELTHVSAVNVQCII